VPENGRSKSGIGTLHSGIRTPRVGRPTRGVVIIWRRTGPPTWHRHHTRSTQSLAFLRSTAVRSCIRHSWPPGRQQARQPGSSEPPRSALGQPPNRRHRDGPGTALDLQPCFLYILSRTPAVKDTRLAVQTWSAFLNPVGRGAAGLQRPCENPPGHPGSRPYRRRTFDPNRDRIPAS
jgi:hypothetical protein